MLIDNVPKGLELTIMPLTASAGAAPGAIPCSWYRVYSSLITAYGDAKNRKD